MMLTFALIPLRINFMLVFIIDRYYRVISYTNERRRSSEKKKKRANIILKLTKMLLNVIFVFSYFRDYIY